MLKLRASHNPTWQVCLLGTKIPCFHYVWIIMLVLCCVMLRCIHVRQPSTNNMSTLYCKALSLFISQSPNSHRTKSDAAHFLFSSAFVPTKSLIFLIICDNFSFKFNENLSPTNYVLFVNPNLTFIAYHHFQFSLLFEIG